jgi:hypothetical protein
VRTDFTAVAFGPPEEKAAPSMDQLTHCTAVPQAAATVWTQRFEPT